MDRIADLIAGSDRPLVWAGHGIRLAGEAQRFRAFIERTGLPCVQTWLGADLLPTDHRLNYGIVGMCGQRGANNAVATCDLLLVLGSHLSAPQTGPTWPVAQNADIVMIDIDQNEIEHFGPDIGICAHLRDFFDHADAIRSSNETHAELVWSDNKAPDIGSYALNAAMTRMLPGGTVMVVDGGGTALYTGFQSSFIKEGSRLICSTAISAMGSGLPEAVGACFANGRKLTTCLIGDGSLMLNIQELQTIKTNRLPIKVFVINNGGYLAIRQTQKAFQDGRYYGVGGDDLQFPRIRDVAETFRIPYTTKTDVALLTDGPCICEWLCDNDQPMLRQGFRDGKPLPLTEMVLE